MSFLTPTAALVGLVALVALVMLAVSEARSRRICGVLGLRPRRPALALGDAVAVTAVAGLLAVAVAQPVVSRAKDVPGRADAEAIVVVDVTRSMQARPGRSGPTRLERARAVAKELRAGIPEVKVGITSLTDRVLPHLFPSLSSNAFAATLDYAVGIERPPPDRKGGGRVTALTALADLGRQNFFSPSARRRVAIVLTDGESVPVDLGTLRARMFQGGVTTVFIHVWRPDERIYLPSGVVERAYRPDPASRLVLGEVAGAARGSVYPETAPGKALDAVRRLLGDGPLAAQGRELQAAQLAPYAVAFALLPLLFLLRRRNL